MGWTPLSSLCTPFGSFVGGWGVQWVSVAFPSSTRPRDGQEKNLEPEPAFHTVASIEFSAGNQKAASADKARQISKFAERNP